MRSIVVIEQYFKIICVQRFWNQRIVVPCDYDFSVLELQSKPIHVTARLSDFDCWWWQVLKTLRFRLIQEGILENLDVFRALQTINSVKMHLLLGVHI